MTSLAQLIPLAEKGPFRSADAGALGIPRTYLSRWVAQGRLERVGRGLYRLVEVEPTELGTIAEVGRRAPRAIVCLLSALEIHELTTESPSSVWLMVEGKNRAPKLDFVRTEVVRASGAAFHVGMEEREIEGVPVRITSPAKTVADCFRFRSQVGLEVALSSLRDYMRKVHTREDRARYSIQLLSESMRACRVGTVMRPYVEALI